MRDFKPTARQLDKFVGNRKVYAKANTKGEWFPVKEPLGVVQLMKHLSTEGVLGTYVLDGNQARFLVFDLDTGEEDLERAQQLADELIRFGVPRRSVGVEFSGRKGYHVWFLLADYVEAKKLRQLGRAVLAAADITCEVFPKQDEAKDLGNLIKLPGGVHPVTRKENNFIDRVPQPASVQVLDRILAKLPPEPDKPKGNGGNNAEVLPCLAAISEGVVSGGRNNSLYHMASLLYGTGRLTDAQVSSLVAEAAAACDPPYDEGIEALLDSAKTGGPVCDTLPEEIKCDPEACVRNRGNGGGFYCREGALRFGQPGEKQVVEIKEKDGNLVTITHPDIKTGGKVRV